MAEDQTSGERRWTVLREKAGASVARLLASATIVGGAATAIAYPDLGVIVAIMLAPSVPELLSLIMESWSRRRLQHMQWSYQRQHQRIAAKALESPENEHLRLLLILHTGTRPDHLGPPPATP
jgi:hypothetical protein